MSTTKELTTQDLSIKSNLDLSSHINQVVTDKLITPVAIVTA